MFNIKIISILAIFVFLFVGCEDPTKSKESNSATKNNTFDDDLDGKPIRDYFYNFDEEIDANYLYYNSYITSGSNTISSPSILNPYLDTLNFHTFPFYTVEIENQLDTVSYLLSLTPDKFDNYSTLYPLDETNTDTLNWCNEMLVEYEGNCPDSVEVSFDNQFATTGTGASFKDTLYSPAIYSSIISKKEVEFNIGWKNIESLIWSNELKRYEIKSEDSTYTKQATMCAGNCDSSFVDQTLPACSEDVDPPCYNPNYFIRDFTDTFDSLIYVGVIDSSRMEVNDLILIDRTEWERYDVEYKSDDKPYVLDTTFAYEQIKVPNDSPMYRVNGDCNQNLRWDKLEVYKDFGSDWCPDSLETGEGSCEVVDTNNDGLLSDEEPCNCLGDWREFLDCDVDIDDTDCNEPNPNYDGPVINPNWVLGSSDDPNGDNWNDCGWDGYCPGHPNDTNGDENETEGNGIWDIFERFEENGRYDLDIITGTREFFIDEGNEVFNEPAEFCADDVDYGGNGDGVCNGYEPFEDRNCNGKWDDAESGDEGNGIWDDDEKFIVDADGDTLLYTLSDRLATFIVDYSDPEHPKPLSEVNTNTTVTSYYGTIQDSVHISYSNFLKNVQIEEYYVQKFHDIDRKETIYTNKIVETALPGIADDYHVTKTKWFQDIVATSFIESDLDNPDYGRNYGYDYHLFKVAENGNISKMIHPAFFKYYGYNYYFADIEFGSWREELPQEEVYIYSVDGLLRAGEEYYHDTTIVTSVADYYVEDLYEVDFDNFVVVPFEKVTYNLVGGDTVCIKEPDVKWLADPNVNIDVESNYVQNCPPVLDTLTNTFKITKTKTITMVGQGLEFGLRNTIWLGSDGDGDPLGIVKDQLEIRWSEPYWEEYGSDWRVISILKLRSLRKAEPESSRFFGIFQPIKKVSLNGFNDEERFNNDPYVVTPSFGIHTLSRPNDK
tara:strand:- start:440 stop:3274 length:2835 start_codon:yes stop_codon:yes gene_type:complete